MFKSEKYRNEALDALDKAKALQPQAFSDDATEADRKAYMEAVAEAKNANDRKNTALADEKLLDDAKTLGEELGLDKKAIEDIEVQARLGESPSAKNLSLGTLFTQGEQFKSVMGQFKGRVPDGVHVQTMPMPVKALITGGDVTSAGAFSWSERTDILEWLGRRTLTLRNLVSVRRTSSDLLEYVRQTSHTNNAAPVAEATTSDAPTIVEGVITPAAGGGYKPQGAWAFERASAAVKTIAEWVPVTKRSLSDVAALQGLIDDELVADLKEVEEVQMLTGDGLGENLEGILNTSGIQTHAKATDDIFGATRRALTKARTIGRVNPNAILLNPVEVEQIDLAREDGATGAFLGGGPAGFGIRTLWGVPIIESEAITAGEALIGDFRKAVLWDREQSTISMTDSHEDYFVRNLVAILAEERVAFAVTRPTAFVHVTGLSA